MIKDFGKMDTCCLLNMNNLLSQKQSVDRQNSKGKKNYILLFVLLISATYTIAQPVNDNRLNATELTNLNNWSSPDAAYSNEGANGAGFDAPWGGYYNVWFKFTAPTNEIDIRVLTGDAKGTLSTTRLQLFDAQGNQLDFYARPSAGQSFVQSLAIVPGNVYYFSVDNDGAPTGTFSLAINSQIGFDHRLKAVELSSANWSSPDAAYSNVGASGAGFNDPWGGAYNVWFKFRQTTEEIEIKILAGGTKGTLSVARLMVFNSAGVKIAEYAAPNVSLRLSLSIGEDYYFSVDGDQAPFQGTFTVQLKNNFGIDASSTAQVIPHIPSWCSQDAEFSTEGATADGINNSSCGTGFKRNVWLKFKASNQSVTAKLMMGALKGTLLSPRLYLADNSKAILSCTSGNGAATLSLTNSSLVVGDWYFLIIDSQDYIGTFSVCLEGGQCPAAPPIDFQFQETNGIHAFTPSLTVAEECEVTYTWDFGDGMTSSEQSPSHEYLNTGVFTVNLTVVYQCGTCSTSIVKEYTVDIGNGGLCSSIYCDGSGGVGINTRKTQGFALSVNGKIRASDIIKVYPQTQWADFVFEKNYKLPALLEVEKFIKVNGHLPGIPSAQEVEKDGVELGVMNVHLLQKIEELTLYVIELNKQNSAIVKQVQGLKQENADLRKKMEEKKENTNK